MIGWTLNRRQVLGVMAAMPLWLKRSFAQSPAQTLTVQKSQAQLLGLENPSTEIWQVLNEQGQALLRAKQGQEFSCGLVNTLDREIWLHFYGVRGPSDMMTVLVPVANVAAPTIVTFTPPDAGTFWISATLDASRLRDMGLSAMLIVEEAETLNNFADVPLMIDDWMVDDAGAIDADFGNLERAIGEGRIGRWFTVNSQFKPRIEIDRSKNNRLRLLNTSNARSFSVVFNNIDLIAIAEDGQPITPRPLGLEPLLLAPGQRIDLLVGNVEEQATMALKLAEDTVEVAFLLASGTASDGVAENFALPPNPLPQLPGDDLTYRPITLTLEGGAEGGLKAATVGNVQLDLRQMLEKGLAWAINGISGPGGPVLFTANKGEILYLTLANRTRFEQVLHVHGHVWAMVERAGIKTTSIIWRDTAVVDANSTIKLVMVADNPGAWAIQSLNAERSDAGLFGGFKVSDMP